MRKFLYACFVIFGFLSFAKADSKLTALTADTTAQAADLIYKVDSPGGTPVSRSITLGNLMGQVAVSSLNVTGVSAGTYGSATQVSSVTIGSDGRITGAANVTISLTNSNLQSGTYSNVTVPAANVAAGSLGGSVIASSITVNAVQGVLAAGSNITLTPGSGTLTIASTGGSATPSGPEGSVQFSSGGVFGGNTGFQYDKTSSSVTIAGNLGVRGIINISSYSAIKGDATSTQLFAPILGTSYQILTFSTHTPFLDIGSQPSITMFQNGSVFELRDNTGASNYFYAKDGILRVAPKDGADQYFQLDDSSNTASRMHLLWEVNTSTGDIYWNGSSFTVVNPLVLSSVTITNQETRSSLSPGVMHIVAVSSVVTTGLVSLSTEVTGSLPAASIAAGSLGASVLASSFPVSGVTSGSYTNTNLTVNAQGIVTAASNGSAGGGGGGYAVEPATVTFLLDQGIRVSTFGFTRPGTTTVVSTMGYTSSDVVSVSTSLTVVGVITATGTTASGMSAIDRGLTVNNGSYSASGSSSAFIVNGNGKSLFVADPIGNLVTSSATFNVYGHIEISSTTPVVSSCGSTPSGSVAGNDVAGKVTIGGGVVTSCTVTFASPWTNAPACTIASNTAITSPTLTTTTTAMTLGSGATFNGDVITYICVGYK